MKKILLASTSIYRKKLLESAGFEVETTAPNCNEEQFKDRGLAPKDLAKTLSELKARSVASKYPDQCIVAGDQVGAFCDVILSKPRTKERALEQLELINGKSHHLYTAITVIYNGEEITLVNDTKLTMRELTTTELISYIDQDAPFDCAGSYKIEGLGINLFEQIESSDYTAIIGIPMLDLTKALKNFGVSPLY